jgi:tetratricopeptide (TPR) repeat protein
MISDSRQEYLDDLFARARMHLGQQKYQDAIQDAQKIIAIKRDYKDGQAQDIIDIARRKLGQVKKQEVRQLASQEEQNVNLQIAELLKQGKRALNSGRYEKASRFFERAITIDPDNLTANRLLREANQRMFKINKRAKKRRMMRTVKQRYSENVSRANKLYTAGKVGRAIKLWEKARKLALKHGIGDIPQLNAYIEQANERMGEEIGPYMQRAFEMATPEAGIDGWIKARNSYIFILEKYPNYGPAKKELKKIERKLFDQAKQLYVSGVVDYSMSQPDTAIEKWRKVLTLVPNSNEYYKKAKRKLEDLNQ